MNFSPGLIAMYWLLAAATASALWTYAVPRYRRARAAATSRCCGMCDQ